MKTQYLKREVKNCKAEVKEKIERSTNLTLVLFDCACGHNNHFICPYSQNVKIERKILSKALNYCQEKPIKMITLAI